ncbi:MAG TPA: hypothetical protein VFR10_03585 [bacterium]|nr:hypothetical protein [bacterium]
MSDFALFVEHLEAPEYVHVLLNPLPVYGMAAGAFLLLFSLLTRNAKASTGPLLWLILVAIATWFAEEYGEKAYDRVYAMSGTEAQQWLDVHMKRAETFGYLFYAVGISAAGALFASRRWPSVSRSLSGLTLLLAMVAVGLGGWISQAGGRVRHSEFRDGPPAADQLPPADEHQEHSQR